jgi:hypothetical protein
MPATKTTINVVNSDGGIAPPYHAPEALLDDEFVAARADHDRLPGRQVLAHLELGVHLALRAQAERDPEVETADVVGDLAVRHVAGELAALRDAERRRSLRELRHRLAGTDDDDAEVRVCRDEPSRSFHELGPASLPGPAPDVADDRIEPLEPDPATGLAEWAKKYPVEQVWHLEKPT